MSVPPNPYDPASQGTPPPPPSGPGGSENGPAFPGYGPNPGYTPSAPGYGPTPGYGPQPGPSPMPVPPPPGGGQPSYGAAPGSYPPAGQQPYGPPASYAPAGYGQGGYGQPPSKSKAPLVVGLIVALVVVVGGVVAAVLLVGRSGGGDVAGTTTDTATAQTPTTQTPEPTDTPTDDPFSGGGDGDIPSTFVLNQSLSLGTCFDGYSTKWDLSDVSQVDCGTPHAMEIVGTFTLTTPFTGQSDPAIQDQVDSCYTDVVTPLVASNEQWQQDTNVDVWYPSAMQISGGSTKGYCMLTADGSTTDEPIMLMGSLIAGTFQGAAK